MIQSPFSVRRSLRTQATRSRDRRLVQQQFSSRLGRVLKLKQLGHVPEYSAELMKSLYGSDLNPF